MTPRSHDIYTIHGTSDLTGHSSDLEGPAAQCSTGRGISLPILSLVFRLPCVRYRARRAQRLFCPAPPQRNGFLGDLPPRSVWPVRFASRHARTRREARRETYRQRFRAA